MFHKTPTSLSSLMKTDNGASASARHSSWSAFGRSTGNNITFSFFSFSVVYFSHRIGVLGSKTHLEKFDRGSNRIRFDIFPDPVSHFELNWR